MKRITKKSFKTWLESKPKDADIGEPLEAYACPIHNYFKEVHNKDVFVGGILVDRYHDRNIDMPVWVRNFIDLVDESSDWFITAETALEALDKV